MTYKRYCITFLVLFVTALATYGACAEWMLHRLNETYVGDDAAVAMQLEEDALYASALTGDIGFLKYGVISKIQPDIIALGTSRTMQFRAPFFKNSVFYTAGGIGDSVDAMAECFEYICRSYVPGIIILAVDWDWLNPNYRHQSVQYGFRKGEALASRIYLYKCLYGELLKNRNVRAQVIRPEISKRDIIGNRLTIGLMAGAKNEGFRRDGSYQVGDLILSPQSKEKRLSDTHKRIREGNRRFERADHIDEAELLKLESLIDKMQRRGCHVIVLLPPFPNEIYQTLMESEGHRGFILDFEKTVHDLCSVRDIPFYDFTNMAWLNASDEEALDGFHASERTYGRITLQMKSDPVIRPYVDEKFIEACMVSSDNLFQIVPPDM
jgi:hypothetical protein